MRSQPLLAVKHIITLLLCLLRSTIGVFIVHGSILGTVSAATRCELWCGLPVSDETLRLLDKHRHTNLKLSNGSQCNQE